MVRRRKKKRKLTAYNKCMSRGMKKGHAFMKVVPVCSRNKNAFRGSKR